VIYQHWLGGKSMALSERQQEIFKYIQRFTTEKGRPPTIREIGLAVNISSTSVVNYNLNILEKVGLISREKEVSRGLRLTGQNGKNAADPRFVQVPLLGRIVAGKPIEIPEPGSTAFEADHESVTLTRDLLGGNDSENLYALHVKGDSMIDASIHDGDIVVMKHQETARNGDLVAAWIKDKQQTTLKRFFKEKGMIKLVPANPSFKTIEVDPKNVSIQGKVVLVIRQLGAAA
jgi:repressor LexA